jgi:hypothetical protein
MNRFCLKRKIMPAFACRPQHVPMMGLPGEQQELAVRSSLLNRNRKLDPAKFRHRDVGKQQVRGVEARRSQRIQWAGKAGRGISLVAQNHRQGLCDHSFIVHDKDSKTLLRRKDSIPAWLRYSMSQCVSPSLRPLISIDRMLLIPGYSVSNQHVIKQRLKRHLSVNNSSLEIGACRK